MGFEFRNVRPYQGGAVSSAVSFQTIAAFGTHTFVDISGQGALRCATFMVNSGNDSHKAVPKIAVDGVTIEPVLTFQAANDRGYNSNTLPFKITEYNLNGFNHGMYIFNPELVFNSELTIKASNYSTIDVIGVLASWVYCKLP